jgi:hypothetical protein
LLALAVVHYQQRFCLNHTQFKNAWTVSDPNLQPISLQTLARFDLDKEAVDYLSQSGLPKDALPFLSLVDDFYPGDKY